MSAFWVLAIGLSLVAVAAAAWPLGRARRSLAAAVAAAAVVAVALPTYFTVSNYDPAMPDTAQSHEALVESLEKRVAEDPRDLASWRQLGRVRVANGDFRGAIEAFEQTSVIAGPQNPEALVDLGEALVFADGESLRGRAGQLFDNAVALAPLNPKALWYAGLADAARGDREGAATHWEALIALGPPPEIQQILERRVAELRGSTPGPEPGVEPDFGAAAPTVAGAAPAEAPPLLSVQVEMAPELDAAPVDDASLFVIAREPGQGGPPLAAVRHDAGELPLRVTLGDDDAMLPGRKLSGASTVTLTARVSRSGRPQAQSGDLYGEIEVALGADTTHTLRIDREVP